MLVQLPQHHMGQQHCKLSSWGVRSPGQILGAPPRVVCVKDLCMLMFACVSTCLRSSVVAAAPAALGSATMIRRCQQLWLHCRSFQVTD